MPRFIKFLIDFAIVCRSAILPYISKYKSGERQRNRPTHATLSKSFRNLRTIHVIPFTLLSRRISNESPNDTKDTLSANSRNPSLPFCLTQRVRLAIRITAASYIFVDDLSSLIVRAQHRILSNHRRHRRINDGRKIGLREESLLEIVFRVTWRQIDHF